MNIMVFHKHKLMRRPGFEPGLPDWQSDVLDQTGRPSLQCYFMIMVILTMCFTNLNYKR